MTKIHIPQFDRVIAETRTSQPEPSTSVELGKIEKKMCALCGAIDSTEPDAECAYYPCNKTQLIRKTWEAGQQSLINNPTSLHINMLRNLSQAQINHLLGEKQQELQVKYDELQAKHKAEKIAMLDNQWIDVTKIKPEPNTFILAAIKHWHTKNIRYVTLKVVDESDCNYITVDDGSELSHDWDVVYWQKIAEIRGKL